MADLSALEQQYGLPAGLLSAVQQTESGGNPNAVSPAGALGLFQFLPSTAKQYGIDPLNPDQAAQGAAQMYSDLLGKYNGDLPSALAAYNWGQGNVDRKGLANAPAETQGYISKIMGQIGNTIIPSANASEMPNLDHLSDDQLQAIVDGKSPAMVTDMFGGEPTKSIQDLLSSSKQPDLSQMSDEQLQTIADGKSSQPSYLQNVKSIGDTALQDIKSGGSDFLNNRDAIEKGLGGLSALGGIARYALAPIEGGIKSTVEDPLDTLLGYKTHSGGLSDELTSLFGPSMAMKGAGVFVNIAKSTPSALGRMGESLALDTGRIPNAGLETDLSKIDPNTPIAPYQNVRPSTESSISGFSDAAKVADLVATQKEVDRLATLNPQDAAGKAQLAQLKAKTDVLREGLFGKPVADNGGLSGAVDNGINPAGQAQTIPANPASNAASATNGASVSLNPIKTADDIKALSQQAYARSEAAGGTLTPQFVDKFVDDASKLAPQTEAGKIIAGDNETTKLIARMQALKGKPMSLQAAQEVDEALGGLIDKEYGLKGLSKEGKQLLDVQTTFRNGLADAAENGHLTGGREGLDAWQEGQKLWQLQAQARDIEQILQRASMMDVPSTGIKTGFRTLANNKTRLRGYTPAQITLINKAAKTGIVTDALRVAGSRLNPIAAFAAGTATGGPIAGAAFAAGAHVGSSIARKFAAKSQMASPQKLLDSITEKAAQTTRSK